MGPMILFDGSCASGKEPAEGDDIYREREKKKTVRKIIQRAPSLLLLQLP